MSLSIRHQVVGFLLFWEKKTFGPNRNYYKEESESFSRNKNSNFELKIFHFYNYGNLQIFSRKSSFTSDNNFLFLKTLNARINEKIRIRFTQSFFLSLQEHILYVG